jgi:putative tryptophan/tyrosine transport system substrate-binding protein
MKRREFITLVGGAATVWTFEAHAQQKAMPVVGFLGSESAEPWTERLSAFREGLSKTGFVEGHSVAIEYRWAEGQYDRLSALAADLVRRQVNVIVTGANSNAALAAKAATTEIPIVFIAGADPIASGVVGSLNRPDSNVTGWAVITTELGPKRLELVHEIAPTAKLFGVLVHPENKSAASQVEVFQKAALSLGLSIQVVDVHTQDDFESAFKILAQSGVGGLVIAADALFSSQGEYLAALAARYAIPAVHQFPAFAKSGGLMSYGTNNIDAWRQTGMYTGRVLKGEKPADLPVQQSTKVELIVNLKAAKALGLAVPLSLLGRADEVIE